MSSWKGPKHLVRGLVLAVIGLGIGLVLVGFRANVLWVTVAAFVGYVALVAYLAGLLQWLLVRLPRYGRVAGDF